MGFKFKTDLDAFEIESLTPLPPPSSYPLVFETSRWGSPVTSKASFELLILLLLI